MTTETTEKKTLDPLYVLRGVLIFCVVLDHYGLLLNQSVELYFPIFRNFFPVKYDLDYIPLMSMNALLAIKYLENIVTSLFITMVGFNLARASQKHNVKFIYILKKCTTLFLLVSLSQIVTAPTLGRAFSIFHLQVWSFLMVFTYFIFTLFKVRGVIIFFFLSLLAPLLPFDKLFYTVQAIISSKLDDFYFYIWPTDFMAFSFLGFWLYFLFDKYKLIRSNYRISALIFLLIALCIYPFLPQWNLSPEIPYISEHLYLRNFFGLIYLSFMSISIMCFFLSLKIPDIFIFRKIHFFGRKSLNLFLVHKVIFVWFFLPIIFLIATQFNIKYGASLSHSLFYTIIALFLFERLYSVVINFNKKSKV